MLCWNSFYMNVFDMYVYNLGGFYSSLVISHHILLPFLFHYSPFTLYTTVSVPPTFKDLLKLSLTSWLNASSKCNTATASLDGENVHRIFGYFLSGFLTRFLTNCQCWLGLWSYLKTLIKRICCGHCMFSFQQPCPQTLLDWIFISSLTMGQKCLLVFLHSKFFIKQLKK